MSMHEASAGKFGLLSNQGISGSISLDLAPWKKSYDQPRQHIKKQRLYFANIDLSRQSYGFSSGYVWM